MRRNVQTAMCCATNARKVWSGHVKNLICLQSRAIMSKQHSDTILKRKCLPNLKSVSLSATLHVAGNASKYHTSPHTVVSILLVKR